MNAIAALLTRKSKSDRIRDLEKEVGYLRSLLTNSVQWHDRTHSDIGHRITLLEEDMENLKESE